MLNATNAVPRLNASNAQGFHTTSWLFPDSVGVLLQMLYFCEYDLMFFKERQQMLQHLKRSRIQHPPGDEIYRNANVSMFEIDGKKEKLFCQNLCYLAKLFLDHKTLFYDVDLFLFYVLCECDERGAHVVG